MEVSKGSKLMRAYGRNSVWSSSRLHSETVTFHIFICDFFLFTNDIDIASFDDDNTLYATSSKTNFAVENSSSVLAVFSHGLKIIGMKASADKSQFLVSTKVCRISLVSLKESSVKLIWEVASKESH